MSKFLKIYGSTIALFTGIITGIVCGITLKDSVMVVKPVGDIFLNLLFTLVVPLVFFSISSSFCKMRKSGIAGKVFAVTAVVFILMLLAASIITYFSCLIYNPLGDPSTAPAAGSLASSALSEKSTGQAVVDSLSVSDFTLLFSKSNLLPLIIFSILLGIATSLCGAAGDKFAAFLDAGNEVVMKVVDLVMYVAPVGLGCYIACTIASVGEGLIEGYIRCVILYLALTVVFFFIIQPLYVLVFGGIKTFKAYWANILPPSITALATGFSAITIPGNIVVAKKMGVRSEIAEGIVPLGINIHKDGSAISCLIKVVFLMGLFGLPISGMGAAVKIIGIALVASIVMGAVPGGGATGELLVCALLGVDPSMAGIIIIIGALIDMPATMINSSCNVAAVYLVDKFCKRENSHPQKV